MKMPKLGDLVVVGFDDGISTGIVTDNTSEHKDSIRFIDLDTFQINDSNGAFWRAVASRNVVRSLIAPTASAKVMKALS